MQPLLSTVLIVKNEADILARTLSALKLFSDEIIVVDTGSTDQTKQIAQEYTPQVFDYVWHDDFAAARTFADSYARGEYLCRWDADWWISPGDAEKIAQLKKQGFGGADLIKMTWVNRYDSLTTEPQWSQPHDIIYKKGVFRWHFPVHEYLQPLDATQAITQKKALDILIFHDKQVKPLRYLQDTSIISAFAESLGIESPDFLRAQLFLAQDREFASDYDGAVRAYTLALAGVQADVSTKDFIQEKILLIHLKCHQIPAARVFAASLEESSAQLRTFLAVTDLMAVDTSPIAAKARYEQFLERSAPLQQDNWGYDHARYLAHPTFMIKKITQLIN
jgi:hypothetical protein